MDKARDYQAGNCAYDDWGYEGGIARAVERGWSKGLVIFDRVINLQAWRRDWLQGNGNCTLKYSNL